MAELPSPVIRSSCKFGSKQILSDTNCIICYKDCNKSENVTKRSENIFATCSKYLHSKLTGNSFAAVNTQTVQIPFCENCCHVTTKLSQLHDQLINVEKQISDLVVEFTLNVVELRNNGETDNSIKVGNKKKDNNLSISNCNSGISNDEHAVQIKIEDNFDDLDESDSNFDGFDEYNMDSSSDEKEGDDEGGKNMEEIEAEKVIEKPNKSVQSVFDVVPQYPQRAKRKAAVKAAKIVQKALKRSSRKRESSGSDQSDSQSDSKGSAQSSNKSSSPVGRRRKNDNTQQENKTNSAKIDPEKTPASAFNCKFCQKTCRTKYQLKKHTLLHTDKNRQRSYKCEVCGKTFARSQTLRDHRHTHADKMPHTCDVCSKGFARLSNYKSHMLVHYGERTFKCEICDYAAVSADRVKAHKLKRHEKCLNKEEKPKPLSCGICGSLWNSKTTLRNHIFGSHKENEENDDHVIIDDIKTSEEFSGNNSEENSEDFFPFKCGLCRETFENQQELRKHTFFHLKNDTNTPPDAYLCGVCGKSFKSPHWVKDHMRIHTGEKPFSCPDCGRSFASKINMKHHKLIHTGEKPYVCDICGKSCLRLRNLERHREITHSAQVPWKCRDCGKPMKCESAFPKHYRRFHPDIIYSKTECVVENETLEGHLQGSNSVNIPWKCRDCGKALKFKTAFKNHYKRFHSDVVFSYKECVLKNDVMLNSFTAATESEEKEKEAEECVQGFDLENSAASVSSEGNNIPPVV